MFTMRSTGFRFGAVLILAAALAGCSAGSPQLIGAQPKQIGSSGYAPPPSWPIVYNAYMEMQVADVDAGLRAAAQIARDYGGYMADGQLGDMDWESRAHAWSTVTLVVPASQFHGAHNALLNLGRLMREDISGEPLGGRPGGYSGDGYSRITVHFSRAASGWRPAPSGWDPARTMARAFEWFVSIFTFLADAVIWVLVVVGPFVLMGWGAVALVRRLRGKK